MTHFIVGDLAAADADLQSEAVQLTPVVLNRTFDPGLLDVLFPEGNYYLDPGFEH